MSSIKRQHTPSPSQTSSPSRTPKAPRVSVPGSPLLCTLPPTCHHPNRPTPLSDTRALEAHYATHHAHVCSSPECGCVFPDPRLLELHLTECHDPLAALRKERGEKIFACHLSSCPRTFATPKTRRLHLISAHAYPKEYFFAVTNKGIGGLLRRWGDGASLLRGPWRPRDAEDDSQGDGDVMSASLLQQPPSKHPEPDSHGANNGMEGEEPSASDSASAPAATGSEAGVDAILVTDKMNEDGADGDAARDDEDGDAEVDALTRDVSALALVPSSVRFGRGGPALRGLATRSGRPAARHMGHAPRSEPPNEVMNNTDNDKGQDKLVGESESMEQDGAVVPHKPPPARGRRGRGGGGGDGRGSGSGGRGIGRGRGFVPPPPRAGFLSRGGAGRGLPRGMIATTIRGRGRGAVI